METNKNSNKKSNHKNHPNQFFDQIYLINLERRPEKLIQSLYQLNRYQIQVKVVPAIDGYHPKYYYPPRPKKDEIPPGAYGYILSWIKTLNHAKQHRYQKILILDDDIILKKDFNQNFQQFIQHFTNTQTEKKWKLILLGASQHANLPEAFIYQDLQAYQPLHTDGSFAVAINNTQNNTVQELLDLLNPHDKLVDSHVLRHLYTKYPEECFVAYPNLIIADVSQSDIRQGRDQHILSEKLNWNLKDYHYPVQQQRPLVSIIVPTYKAEKTIKRSLQSILDQTYRPLEVILINDGSPDQTLEEIHQTLNEWQYHPKARDIDFKLLHQNKNQGCYPSRNLGLQYATGEFITFQDADDVSLDHRIERQVTEILKKNTWMVSCQILRTHLHQLPNNPYELEQAINKSRIHPDKYCCRAKIGLVTILFHSSIFKKYGNYPAKHKWGEDAIYLHQIFPEAPLEENYKIMNYLNDLKNLPPKYYQIPEILYLSHEMTDNNLTTQRLKHQSQESKQEKTQLIKNFINKKLH